MESDERDGKERQNKEKKVEQDAKATFGLIKNSRLVMPRRGKRINVALTALLTCEQAITLIRTGIEYHKITIATLQNQNLNWLQIHDNSISNHNTKIWTSVGIFCHFGETYILCRFKILRNCLSFICQILKIYNILVSVYHINTAKV